MIEMIRVVKCSRCLAETIPQTAADLGWLHLEGEDSFGKHKWDLCEDCAEWFVGNLKI